MADVPVGDLIARLRLQTNDFQQGITRAQTLANQGAARISGALRQIAGIALPVSFGAALAAGLQRAASAAVDFQRSMARIDGVLKATGNTAGLTARNIDEIVRRIDRASLAEASELREAAAQLLTFKAVAGDTFERVLTLSQDLAAVGFGSISSASKQLGRALEDPVKGMAALRRMGVVFNETQQETIKGMVAVGDLLGAQDALLDAVTSKVGGAGAAEGGGLVGAWDDLNDSFDHFVEQNPKVVAALDYVEGRIRALAGAFESLSGGPRQDAPDRLKTVADRLAVLDAEMRRLQEPLKPRESSTTREAQVQAVQNEINALVKEQIGLVDELTQRVTLRGEAEIQAAERAAEAANVTTDAERKAAAAVAKKQAAVEDSVSALEIQARVMEAQATLALDNYGKTVYEAEAATNAFNRALFVSEKVAEQAAKAIESGLSGQALGDLVLRTRAAAEKLYDEQAALAARTVDVAKDTAGEVDQVWTNAIENIQDGFGDLFTKMLTDGKAAFDNLGGMLKSMFARVIGELTNAAIFKPLFASLAGALTPGVAGASTGGLAGSLAGSVVGTINQGLSSLFEQIGLSIGGLLGSSNAVGIGQAFGKIGGSLGGILAGGALAVSVTELRDGTKLAKVGSAIGSAVGGSLGALSGVGGIGSVGAGVGLGALVGGIEGIVQGNGQLGANIGMIAGGALALYGTGLIATAAIPVVGWVIAIIGAIVLAVVALLPKNVPKITIATALDEAGLPSLEGGHAITRESPFGTFGAVGSATSGDFGQGAIAGLLDTIQAVDLQLAQHLSRTEEELIRAAGLPLMRANAKDTARKIGRQRIQDVLESLGVPTLTTTNAPSDLEEAIQWATGIIDARSQILDLVDELRGVGQEANAAEEALEKIEDAFDAIRFRSPSLGLVIDDLEGLRAVAIQRLIDGFNDQISDAILAITDPAALAVRELEKAQEKRLLEAQTLGADLVEVERLNMLERQRLLEQINDPLIDLLDQLRIGQGILTPTDTLGAARTDFNALASVVSAGQFVDPSKLAETSRLFLDASRAVNASGPAFFADLALVQAILEQAKGRLPGFATGGSFQIASGGYENVVPLFRASRNETVTVTPAGGASGPGDDGSLRREMAAMRGDLARIWPELLRLSRKVS